MLDMYVMLLHHNDEGVGMNLKRKLIAGTLALVPIALVASYAITGVSYESAVPQRLTTMDAPQNKFGFSEAMQPSLRMPSMDIREERKLPAFDAATAASDAAAAGTAASSTGEGIPPAALAPGLPKIAYTYLHGYRIAAGEIPGLQRRHADFCEKQGPRVCSILSLQQSGEEGEYAHGTLELAVAASRARGFGTELARSVEAAGGKEIVTSISGEDLSKQIVDTEARLRARTLLRDRLMEVLASRKGTVAELVEAERGVAQVNEEIDEARSWLFEMKGRVEFSRLAIEYSAGAPTQGGFTSPIRSVFGNLGAILGTTIAVLIWLLAVALPIGLLGWGVRRLWLRFRSRLVAEPLEA
jgi:Domain of unknown function (DUF4349)